MATKNVLVFGGTGFVGEFICNSLKQAAYDPVVVTHSTQSQYRSIKGSLSDTNQLAKALGGLKFVAVVYSVGLLIEQGNKTYDNFHRVWVQNAINLSENVGCDRFILISANGISNSNSGYAISKLAGEQLLQDSNLEWTILRPSIIVGKSDNFNFLKLLDTLTKLPFAPVPAAGALIQPVNATELGDVTTKIIDNPTTYKKIYAVCGNTVFTMRSLVKEYATSVRRRVITVPVPTILVKLFAPVLRLFGQPVTKQQLEMLEKGNTSSDKRIWEVTETNPTDVFNHA